MGTTAREGLMEFGKGRNRWSDGSRPSVVVGRSAWGSWSSNVLRYSGCDRFIVDKAREFVCM